MLGYDIQCKANALVQLDSPQIIGVLGSNCVVDIT
jgi:hypothetical protein